MEHKQRAKMPASQRAKQFMPFAAVKGLEKAIAKEERELKRGERPEFGEEQIDAVNSMLCQVRTGMEIFIQVYSSGQCVNIKGHVERVNLAERKLMIDGIRIGFDDILAVLELAE